MRKAGFIRDVVETISRIPDPITRSAYIKQSSEKLNFDEKLLIAEMNKLRRTQISKAIQPDDAEELLPEMIKLHSQIDDLANVEFQEKNIIRLLLNYGNSDLHFSEEVESDENPTGKKEIIHVVKVFRYIVTEIAHDDIVFENKIFNEILQTYSRLSEHSELIEESIFLNPDNPTLSSIAVELLSPKYFLSENWQNMHKINVPEEAFNLQDSVEKAILYLKKKKVMKMIEDNRNKIHEAQLLGEDCTSLLTDHMRLEQLKIEISKGELGIDILG